MLSNFQVGGRALLQSFLIGQPELRRILQGPDMQQFRQRVIASYHLSPLDPIETQAYIQHRLKQVGWVGDPQIEDERLRRYFRVHRGNPSPHQPGLQPAPARGIPEREARARRGGRRDGREGDPGGTGRRRATRGDWPKPEHGVQRESSQLASSRCEPSGTNRSRRWSRANGRVASAATDASQLLARVVAIGESGDACARDAPTAIRVTKRPTVGQSRSRRWQVGCSAGPHPVCRGSAAELHENGALVRAFERSDGSSGRSSFTPVSTTTSR